MSLTKVSYSMIAGSPVNVLDFGAIGNGIHDDTSAIQSALNASTAVYIPPGTYRTTSTITIPFGRSLFGYSQRFSTNIIADYTIPGAIFQLEDSASISNLYVDVAVPSGVWFKSITVGIEGKPDAKWLRINNCFVLHCEFGIRIRGYYSTVSDCQAHSCQYGIAIGGNAEIAGAATIIGCHLRDNYTAGLYIYSGANANYGYNNTFEYNNNHIICNGDFSHYGGYLGDPPVNVVTGTGNIKISQGFDVFSAGADDNGARYGLNTLTTNPCYAIKCTNAVVEDVVLQINAQSRTGGVLLGAVVGTGNYTFRNTKFKSQDTNLDAVNIFEYANQQLIDQRSDRFQNWVANGTFLDASAINATYISALNGSTPISTSNINPWGGKIIRTSRYGSAIKYSIPNQYVGKRHFLYIVVGKTVGSPTYPIALQNDAATTALAINFSSSQTQYNGTSTHYNLIQGSTTALALNVFDCYPTVSSGMIDLFINASDGTPYSEIAAIILTPVSSLETNYPIGWFDSIEAIAL